MRVGWRHALVLYGAYGLGVVALTWPLARHPSTLWPSHHDARVFTWVMASMAHRLVEDPRSLFQGNAFYPNGSSLAYSEMLLPPSLLGVPGFLWGQPVLTYNLLLLLLWPLNGLAMAWVAHALTGSRAAAAVAGAVFCLSPYFSEYYLELQMLLAAPLPLALFAWIRWLETGAPRWLALTLAMVTLQALTTWYYAIILGSGLVVLGLGFACLRWRGWAWRQRLVALAIGAVAVAAALGPFALPYVAVHGEFGYERRLDETAQHYADVTSFVEGASRSRLYTYAPSGQTPETTPFVGFTILALAAASLPWLRGGPERPAVAVWLGRLAVGALAGSLLAAACLIPIVRLRVRLGPVRFHLYPATFLEAALLLAVVLLLIQGWLAWRTKHPRPLGPADWVRCLWLLAGVMALLALGPVVHVARQDAGPGPYLHLYPFVMPLHVVRVTVRFAVLTVASFALLAALGLRAIEDRLASRPGLRRAVLALVALALAAEYAVTPAEYESVQIEPRPVDVALRAAPGEVAVLEWPTNVADTDADAMVRSLYHGKFLVNGLSGFIPPSIPELFRLLTTPDAPFPTPEAQAALRRIHPLRYLVVRLADPAIPVTWHPVWLGLRRGRPPLLEFVGSFGADDLYEVVSLPEEGARIVRLVSYEFLRTHPVLTLAVQPQAGTPTRGQWVEIRLNDRLVRRVPLEEPVTLSVHLPPPYLTAFPNAVMLVHGSGQPPAARDDRYRIGATETLAPGHLDVASSGDPERRVGSVRLNDVELARDRRGYNLVALHPTRQLVRSVVFDTFLSRLASEDLAAWVTALPSGTIVAGAVRDEGSARLTEAAVQALRTLGVAGDLRGRFREAHAFVGVKGAPPGSALEKLGSTTARLRVGQPPDESGMTLTAFTLTRSPDRGDGR